MSVEKVAFKRDTIWCYIIHVHLNIYFILSSGSPSKQSIKITDEQSDRQGKIKHRKVPFENSETH